MKDKAIQVLCVRRVAFEFGVQGWSYGDPKPTSITFFLDNTAMVCDQYGRQIRRAVQDGVELRFADTPPLADRDGGVMLRPQFATHAQVIDALQAEHIDWLAYEVRYRARDNRHNIRSGLKLADAIKLQSRLMQEGASQVTIGRTVACAGWPQLSYAKLKELPEIPPTPAEELRKIRDSQLRKDALRIRHEIDSERAKEWEDQRKKDEE